MFDPRELAFSCARIALAHKAVNCIVRKSIQLEDYEAIRLGVYESGYDQYSEEDEQRRE